MQVAQEVLLDDHLQQSLDLLPELGADHILEVCLHDAEREKIILILITI